VGEKVIEQGEIGPTLVNIPWMANSISKQLIKNDKREIRLSGDNYLLLKCADRFRGHYFRVA